MNVEIWSDIACPWCYIGKRRFEAALERFEHADQVEVHWRSFELDPAAPAVRPGGVVEHLAAKYGQTPAAARAMVTNIEQVAAGEGLEFHMEDTAGGNTFDAHRLLHLAQERGRQDELKEELLRAYFTDGRPVADRSALTDAAVGAGLDRAEAEAVLGGENYADAVRDDEAQAYALGISAVPFFVLDRKYGVAGAQPTEVLLDALRRAWTDAHPLEPIGASESGGACEGDSCAI
ncbi:MAG TPA: DsbA family oxidoreductase [Acidimicrobiia bacterium]|jgi:predicted DsbA family dithiol-disulfide isomerase